MNRKIVFRGKCVPDSKYAGEWVTGGYVPLSEGIIPNDEGLIVRFLGDNNTITYHVAPNTIGQFTGLQDSNGNDIYEGDIIYCEFGDGSNIKMLIGWNENEACFGLMDEYKYRSKLKGYAFPKFDNDVLFNFRDAERFEIVGNVFDNSDLLH